MAYTVNKTNSSSSPNQYTVQDGVVNTQTDLSLIGKGYAGYGESIAENFLHLLENFSNTSAPSKPIQGQLWWDSTNSKLQVYNGTAWQTAGGSAPYQSTAPSGLAQGDIWIDSDTGQMYFYNGTSSVLVGPPSSTGTTNGFTFDTILDSGDTSQNITKLFNDGNLIAVISEDEFTPKATLSGFATVKKGITLTTAIADTKFQGTASDADALGGVAAANYLRSNANDATSGTISIANDGGLIVGTDSDMTLTVDASGGIISNTVPNTDITFKVNDGGTTTTVMTIDGSESRIGIGTTTPTTKLEVSGTTTSTAFAGPLTGNVTGNITSTGANSMTTLTMGGNLTSKAILPDTDASYDIGTSLKGYNTVYAKATSAQYADLAEMYVTKGMVDGDPYPVGTVMYVPEDINREAMPMCKPLEPAGAGNIPVGTISENPAFLMNNELENGQPVALKGRVPVRVIGPCMAGQPVYVADGGVASINDAGQSSIHIVGIALVSKDTEEEKLVECILKV
jgi:hypothetical protein